jgi:hypothetical protein
MKTILFTLLLGLAFGCSKDNSTSCEKWEVNENCTPKASGVVCSADVMGKETTVCGDDLANARVGNTVVIREDANIKITRTYIKKL